jgi:pyruvate formate lyase activating enzyme
MKSIPLHHGEKGLIFNIQRFSVHDGPGIRTTVFLKGCPLNCLWCSNPESQSFFPELMVRDILCKGCGACVEICPRGAITISQEEGRRIDRGKCDRCFLCLESCQYQALSVCGKYMKVGEILDEVLQDRLFYKNSGGGVTLSGGEVLSQGRFVGNVLKTCRKEGLHTVLDTSGYGPWKEMEAVLPFVDLILFDFKHLNPDEHKRTTGVGNKIILENLQKASKMTPVWLRIPLISGFNDSKEQIKMIALLGKQIGAKKISLLPYHEGGKSKSEQLGRIYPLPEARAPEEEHIHQLKSIIEKEGLQSTIGN